MPGIGPKKASDLIKKYGSIDGIYTHSEEISPDLRQKLVEGKESAYNSRELVQLHSIPDLGLSLDKFHCSVNFDHYSDVLVHDFHFSSLEKTLHDMKKKFQTPQQTSLF